MFPIDVAISSGEMVVLEWLAGERGAMNRAAGVKDRRVGGESSTDYDLDGVIGERAVAKVLGVPMDLTTHLRSHGVDMVAPSGASIDVKTSRVSSARLISPVGKRLDADVLVLAIIRSHRDQWRDTCIVTVSGWAFSDDLTIDENRVDPGGSMRVRCPTYVLPRGKLRTEAISEKEEEDTARRSPR